MYDYYLDGKDNFEVDRAAVDAMSPRIRTLLKAASWENRRFVWRVVHHLVSECGITQFIDVGSGLPTVRSTHEVAQEVNPDVRVVYVDNDPIVISHGQALLTENGKTAIVAADVRDPDSVLNANETRALIDFEKPVAVLFVALLHFLPDPGHPRHVPGDPSPGEIVAAFRDRVAPGSYSVMTNASVEGVSAEDRALVEGLYERSTSPAVFRSSEEIAKLFTGWRLIPPGIVRTWAWPVEDSVSPHTDLFYGGVGVKDDDASQ
jgi:hypothetical protein